MNIIFSPQRSGIEVEYRKQDNSLFINGEEFDFSFMNDGDVLPPDAIESEFIVGEVRKENGELHLTLLLPHGPNATYERRFPQPIFVTEDGPVELPPYEGPSADRLDEFLAGTTHENLIKNAVAFAVMADLKLNGEQDEH